MRKRKVSRRAIENLKDVGMSHLEIAERLGVSERTVSRRLNEKVEITVTRSRAVGESLRPSSSLSERILAALTGRESTFDQLREVVGICEHSLSNHITTLMMDMELVTARRGSDGEFRYRYKNYGEFNSRNSSERIFSG